MYSEVYLDNSATTRALDEVIEYMDIISKEYYGNPSSLHRKGIEAERLIKKWRESIAASLGAENREIYFTSGGTESNNLAIRGYLDANPRKGKHIICSKIEHPSVLEVYKYLCANGYQADYVNVNTEGMIDLDDLHKKIRDDTSLISIVLVNNEIGTIQPVEKISEIKNNINKEAVLHIDAVQAYGKIKILPQKSGIDMMSFSSHKIHGPKGVGVLYVNKSKRIKPILFGGGQEALLRSGTENVPGICGFGLASEIVHRDLKQNQEKVNGIKRIFLDELKTKDIEYKAVSPENALPNIINISFPNVKAEVLLHHLEERSIFVSTGSACSSRKNKYSHVLQSIGLAACDIEGAIRFSFSHLNTEEDARITVEALKEILPVIQIKKNKGGRK
ncbi:MAG: cysteine desulfurase [Clostridia bacterium]|nr:cysteine desulfurase [Clostridia bacterium]